jgi:thiamine-phosphate pyrophosphorylase
LLVNERLDVALAGGAEGVHLPSDSLPLSAVRARAGEAPVVGISCHGAEEVERAAADGATYVLLGPIFETPSKPGAKPLGLSVLQEVCRRFRLPVFALGGVHLTNAEDCIRAGAAGVAAIRLFQDAADLDELCRRLRSL